MRRLLTICGIALGLVVLAWLIPQPTSDRTDGPPPCLHTPELTRDCSDRDLYLQLRGDLVRHQDEPHYTAAAVALFGPYLAAPSDLASALDKAFSNPNYGCMRETMLRFVREIADLDQTALFAIALYKQALAQLATPLPSPVSEIVSRLIDNLAPTSPFRAAQRITGLGDAKVEVADNLASCFT